MFVSYENTLYICSANQSYWLNRTLFINQKKSLSALWGGLELFKTYYYGKYRN